MAKLTQTPSQTVGPYFAYGLTSEQYGYDFKSLFGPVLAEPQAAGEHIRLTGRVFDGDGVPVNDAMLEIRQPDAADQPKPGGFQVLIMFRRTCVRRSVIRQEKRFISS